MSGPTFVVKVVGMNSCMNIGMSSLIYIQGPFEKPIEVVEVTRQIGTIIHTK